MSTPLPETHIALTDLHGAYYTMIRLLNAAPKGLKLVFGGDLIDRGPHSRKVVEFAITHAIPTVSGNHEDLALAYSAHRKQGYHAKCASYYERDIWLYNGGDKALAEWKDQKLPNDVLDWMSKLPYHLTPSDQLDENGRSWLLSHTGYALNADTGHWFSTLWGRRHEDGPFARDPATGEERDDGRFRSLGHTPVKEVLMTDTYCNHDTGAVYADRGGGTLSAFIWPSKRIISQPYDETPCEPTFTVVNGVIS